MSQDEHSQGLWNAYVELGADKEERVRRLAEVPEDIRWKVKNHVSTVFRLRKQAHDKSLQKQRDRGRQQRFKL